MAADQHYLPEGLPIPVAEPDGLSAPHWAGLREGELRIQCCKACKTWRWGPEWIPTNPIQPSTILRSALSAKPTLRECRC